MFNGIWPEPTKKRFYSAYLQFKYLILEKFTVIHFDQTKLFPVHLKSPWYFRKKYFSKTKKIRVRFSIGDFPAKPAKQKKQVALKKALRLHTRGGLAAAAEWVYKFLPTGLPRRWSAPKIAARWHYTLPSNNLIAHYNSQFFCKLSFWFWPGTPKMPLNTSELGPNII